MKRGALGTVPNCHMVNPELTFGKCQGWRRQGDGEGAIAPTLACRPNAE